MSATKVAQKERLKKVRQKVAKPTPYIHAVRDHEILHSLSHQGDCLIINDDGKVFYIPKFSVH